MTAWTILWLWLLGAGVWATAFEAGRRWERRDAARWRDRVRRARLAAHRVELPKAFDAARAVAADPAVRGASIRAARITHRPGGRR